MSGYDERTYVEPTTGSEVYGQDGYSWYCDRDTASMCFKGVPTRDTLNPLFVELEGMTAAKLRSRGLVRV